ncbi:unnamed protein product [Phytophthora lilii]|uniref:Unnamed protein product n=1 Tax=Phytophthora lilii TaxID=2077276 RepID=A0A9W6WIE4_9STRA|nr:unnamed protein product [Phytophthora lilii]
MERVQRLVKANRTLRAQVQLEEMDPDVLVLVSEGSLILLVFLAFLVVSSQSIVMSSGLSTGELDWEALGVSDDTRAILRQIIVVCLWEDGSCPTNSFSGVPNSGFVSTVNWVVGWFTFVAATRESESSASTALVVRDSSIPGPPSAKTGAVQKSAAKTQAKSKKSSQKKKRSRSTRAPSESSVPGMAPSEASVAARSSTSRPQSRRRQATRPRPQVDASMSSLPCLDSSSLRPVPIPGPIHGDQPQVRFPSK